MNTVRVRFAPSPTGHLHIGGLRTALFNWLFARQHHGVFLLRIEDTDLVRSRAEYTESLLTSLAWAGITSDEPLVTQSDRMDIYRDLAEKLIEQGKAYRCFCPTVAAVSDEDYFKYDGRCRTRAITSANVDQSYVIRIKLPLDRKNIEFNDLIRGHISIDIDQLDDFIIVRSDGIPVYNFVVVIDDAMMKITHVIRGEDHIPNTPKQIILYEAFGYTLPKFAHLPLILGPHGGRLSKRDAATAVTDYKNNGYLADALCNYLVRLGWSHGDQEIFTREELISLFSLQAVGKKASMFDQAKLDWINGIYIRSTSAQALYDIIIQDVQPEFSSALSSWSQEKILQAISLYKDRVKTLKEMADDIHALYNRSSRMSSEDKERWIGQNTAEHLILFKKKIQELPEFTLDALSLQGKAVCQEVGIKLVQLAQPLRLALTGTAHGPSVFEVMMLLSKEETVKRIEEFILDLTKAH